MVVLCISRKKTQNFDIWCYSIKRVRIEAADVGYSTYKGKEIVDSKWIFAVTIGRELATNTLKKKNMRKCIKTILFLWIDCLSCVPSAQIHRHHIHQ